MIFALLDGKDAIDEPHLRAAHAVWEYAQASAEYIFGHDAEDPLVTLILGKLKAAEAGLSRTQLHEAFGRNLPAQKILDALAKLRDRGDAHAFIEHTGGRRAERWFARISAEPIRKNEETSIASCREEDTSFFRTPSGESAGNAEVDL